MRNCFISDEKIFFLDGIGCKFYIPVTIKPFPCFIRSFFIKRIIKRHVISDLRLSEKRLLENNLDLFVSNPKKTFLITTLNIFVIC